MADSMNVHELLAKLFSYPADDYRHQIERCRDAVAETGLGAASHLTKFLGQVGGLGTESLQELFTQTFDLNPVCVLEVGWQLYGDEYRRGEFLVRMRQSLHEHSLQPSTELPDHLTVILRLLPSLEPEEAEILVAEFVLPAMDKMLAGLEGKRCAFEDLLRAAREFVAHSVHLRMEGVTHA